MRKIIVRISIVLVILVAVILIYASTRPDSFRVERTLDIQAPPETIYAQISDFRSWTAWSPYEKWDPAMKRTFSGTPNGKGAVYAWAGNSDVGTGRMEITETEPPSRIVIRLNFLKPFEAQNIAEFTIDPKGGTSQVTWAMYGPSHFFGKVMGIFYDMDNMIGSDFETGLLNLKAICEQ